MMQKNIQKNMQKNRGYTLLFAVLVSSVVLSVGISILTISKKEFLLSSSARESVSAFYAADAGLECAQYHEDNDTGAFSTTTDGTRPMPGPGCMSQTPKITIDEDASVLPNSYSFSFELKLQNSSNACAVVEVNKIFRLVSSNWISSTTMTSRGYNLGWNIGKINHSDGPCSDSSPRRVERAIEYTY